MIPHIDDKTIADPDPLWRRVPPAMVVFDDNVLIAQVTAGLARECDQAVVRDPQPEEPAHALVCGHKTRGIQSRLAKMSTWVISPGM